MEAVESFWWAKNPSQHSLPEAWKSQNQWNDTATSRLTCISPKHTPFSPLWPHKRPYRSLEDVGKSTVPFLLAHIHGLRAWKLSFPLSMIGIDFLGPLPFSVGNQYVLLIDDHFIKCHEVIALPDQSPPTTTKALVDHWITRFDCPESLHFDHGRSFEATFFTSLNKLLQLDEKCTTSFHLQSDAVIERINRTLRNMLARMTNKNQRNWSDLLPYVMFAYRTSVHESTVYTPYFLLVAMKWPYQ